MSRGISIEINIPDETRRAIAACKDKRGLGLAVARAMDRENQETVKLIHRKLNGPVLHVRTGTLWKSIGATRALVLDDRVESTVGSGAMFGNASVKYAAFWEFGYRGTETIAAHARKSRKGGTTQVREHSRKVNQEARSFIGSSVADREPDYSAGILRACAHFFGGQT